MSNTHRRIRIGIDTGGTFTDVVAFDEDAGTITTTKTPSTPSNPADGFINGIDKVLDLLEASGSDITAVSHGTTVATNQLLEGKVEPVGFITTEGYEFVLEIARQTVPNGYGNSYFWVKPSRITPADLVKTVGGRMDFEGNEVRPFDVEGARQVARWFKERGITTMAVNFLHAYANPAHEQAMRAILEEEYPGVVVSLSSEVLREYREYERSMTTLVDAAVKPKVSAYVTNISERLHSYTEGGHAEAGGSTGGAAPRAMPFYIMKSNGGVLSADEVVHQPITTVLSGPAAGALGAALIAGKAGFDRVLTCDGGGTSTDVCVALNGEPTLTTEGTVGAYPSKIPMIDVVTVGAGGGSIAWISPEGSLKVGPHSAGADPGPLCYGNGGADGAPTITDAHLLLGRIPAHLLGGEIPLDADASRAGLERLAQQLDLSIEHAAAGILEISAWNQANALRQVSVKRGLDVREFMLATFGGSGSLLACRLVDILDLAGVIVPLNPGNVSAFGLLTVDVKNDYVQTMVAKHAALDLGALQQAYTELTERAAHALDIEGFTPEQHQYQRSADLRYVGQAFEVRVSVPEGDLDAAAAETVADAFHEAHRALYGYDFRGDDTQPVEWVNLRVTGIGPITRPELPTIAEGDGSPERACTSVRPVCFDADADYVDTPVFWRPDLRGGDTVEGPAIIEEFGSTIPVHPGFTVKVDPWGNLVITKPDTVASRELTDDVPVIQSASAQNEESYA
ncbi:hydantoinase/oxoprolinase family protein [Ornithinimicrobium pratense]|uniref:Hydantoinase/oxoprolinase family protein n=1 Tax=Ornithinimicrobium pratense TaxID=2593973 RepID=A0A5J6V392_9MICO|nr:hydantoinase/oxoprolinase family protein [Ornithinimicrobium pratense]QFG67784.1 hydantoinase/oxoprolinase family protein [Ornithinimicrobium pratense]